MSTSQHLQQDYLLLSDLRLATGVRMRTRVIRPGRYVFGIEMPTADGPGVLRGTTDATAACQMYVESCALLAVAQAIQIFGRSEHV